MWIFLISLIFSISVFAQDFLPSTFSADYEESYKSVANGREKKSFGKIDYKYPRHIKFEVISPDASTFVANPKTSWYYTPPFIEGEEGQVVIEDSSQLTLTKFLDSLKNGAKSNSSYSVSFNKSEMTLTFLEKLKKELQIDKAILYSKTDDASKVNQLNLFEKLQLIYSNGRQVTMRFLDFKSPINFSSQHFDFKIPPQTRISRGKNN